MMMRLLERADSSDPELARAARLLRTLRPLQPSAARMARVQAALTRQRHRRFGLLVLQPVPLALILLGVVTIAGAAVGQRWIRRLVQQASVAAPVPRTTAAPSTTITRLPDDMPPTTADEPLPAPLEPVLSPPRQDPHAETRHPRVERRPRRPFRPSARVHPDPAAAVRSKGSVGLESVLVLDAVNALRRDHDPGRAAMLLEFYLSRYPSGLIAEEALALAVEAAAAERSTRKARALAERYFKRYPSGRFREVVRRARESVGGAKR